MKNVFQGARAIQFVNKVFGHAFRGLTPSNVDAITRHGDSLRKDNRQKRIYCNHGCMDESMYVVVITHGGMMWIETVQSVEEEKRQSRWIPITIKTIRTKQGATFVLNSSRGLVRIQDGQAIEIPTSGIRRCELCETLLPMWRPGKNGRIYGTRWK